MDDCRPIGDEYDYYSGGNNSRVGCSDENDDCRTMDVDEVNVYSDGGNNLNAGCTDESAGGYDLHYYSDGGNNSNVGCTDESAGGYSSDESFGDG